MRWISALLTPRPAPVSLCAGVVNLIAEPTSPRPELGRELKAVLDAERAGHPFLLYRDGDGDQRLVVLEDPSLGWMFIEGGPRLAGGLAEAVSAKLCG